MELRQYLDSIPRGGATALASTIGISSVYLSQLAARQDGRKPSPELCVQIERATERKVTRRDLRPDDWHLIWPELAELDDTCDVVHLIGAPSVEPQDEVAHG